MNNINLEKIINKKLKSNSFKDYIPNGLQIEGKSNIKKIITGVTACQKLLNYAVNQNANAIIVHHGYFWNNDSKLILGIKRKRLKTILINNINLYSWHLPLDCHYKIGNNAQIANKLNIKIIGKLNEIVFYGEIIKPLTPKELKKKIEEKLKNNVFYYGEKKSTKIIKKIAWCTGKGQKYLELAAKSGMDAFITGEASEETIHIASENLIHFYSAGHHATEKGGIIALGKWLSKKYNLNVKFIDIPNPI